MKSVLIASTLLVAFCSTSIAAEKPSCKDLAEDAAVHLETGGKISRTQMIDRSSTVKVSGEYRVYRVELNEQYSDGSSSESFPPVYYQVVARGSAGECKIVSTKSVK